MRGIFCNVGGKLINQISERFVNAPCSYQEANYHYQLPLFVSRIIRLITKLPPFGDEAFRTKPPLSSDDTVSAMKPIGIWTSWRSGEAGTSFAPRVSGSLSAARMLDLHLLC